MEIRKSGEDYLEAILILERQSGAVRSIDLARHMGYSKASISHATSALRKGGFLVIDKDGCLRMTDKGREIAERIYERHQFFTMQLITAGVDPEIAEYEACLIEHAVSQDSFEKSGMRTNRKNRIKVARRSNCADKSSQRVKIVRLCPLAIL